MADEPDDRPSLEMPSFSLRRRRGSSASVAGEPTVGVEPVAGPEPEPVLEAPLPVDDAPAPTRTPLSVPGLPASVVAGVLVGCLAVAIAWLAGTACDATRGTSSCGGAAGLPVLLAALAVMAYAGTLLLRALRVPDAGATSLLAVGVLAVLVLAFLLGSLDEWWAVVAVPVASALAYATSWWVTTSVAGEDTGAEPPLPHDVR